MNKYLKNKYVIFGIIGLAFYIYKRRQILKSNPKVKKSIEKLEKNSDFEIKEVKEETPIDNPKVGSQFIEDVASMDNKVLKRTMETNKQMLKRAKMSEKKRGQIKDMLAYMKKEYDKRTRKG